jgi:hypothetical protein
MIIGLLGFIGSGKGTAGELLERMGFTPVSFASGVKDVTAEMFGWPRGMLEGVTEHSRKFREQPDEFWSKEFGKPFTPRYALQLMGTEIGRDIFHKDFWIIKLKREIEKNPNKHYVITDVRFQNEIEFVHNMGGCLIEIQRGLKPHWYTIASQANRGDSKAETFMLDSGVHESEWRWIGGPIDYTIDNDGTLEELKSNLIKKLATSYGSNTIEEMIAEAEDPRNPALAFLHYT